MNEPNLIYSYRLPIALAISHLLLAILYTMELITIDFYTIKEKIFWFLIIWLVPVIGLVWFYQQMTEDYKKDDPFNDSE